MLLIVGLGKTGISVLKFLASHPHYFLQNKVIAFDKLDLRNNKILWQELQVIKNKLAQVRIDLKFNFIGIDTRYKQPNSFSLIISSPGIAIKSTFLRRYQAPIIGDLEIFDCYLRGRKLGEEIILQNLDSRSPYNIVNLAVTGSNGKTSVAHLTYSVLKNLILHQPDLSSNFISRIGGNIGNCVLDMVLDISNDVKTSLNTLEISSFQIETLQQFYADIAIVLNLSEDHLDRYADYKDYQHSKFKLLTHAKHKIVNVDGGYIKELTSYFKQHNDIFNSSNKIKWFYSTSPSIIASNNKVLHSLRPIASKNSKISIISNNNILVYNLDDASTVELVNIPNLTNRPLHAQSNFLAVVTMLLALSDITKKDDFLTSKYLQQQLAQHASFPHRCEEIANQDFQGNIITWINDSKATNIGATISALNSYSNQQIYLILGGDGKKQNFVNLSAAITSHVKWVFIYGKDKDIIYKSLVSQHKDKLLLLENLQKTVFRIKNILIKEISTHAYNSLRIAILLSPACASFDQFSSYQERGEIFKSLVDKAITEM